MVNMQRPTIITGDINVCLNKEPRNLLTTVLNDLGFNQLVKDATHVRGGKIDHAYARDPESQLSSLNLKVICLVIFEDQANRKSSKSSRRK